MNKFAILALGLALAGCGSNQIPAGSHTTKVDNGAVLHTVCLDGVEYWFREGNNAVLAPRMRTGAIGTQAHVATCTQTAETNDAAVIAVTAQM